MRNTIKNDYDAEEEIPLEDLEGSGLRWMSVAVVLLVVAGFFALAWYAYRSSSAEDGGNHIVRAEAGPLKEKPVDPGGMQTPYQDMSVYNVISPDAQKKEQVEHLLPEPEEPLTVREEQETESARRSEDLQVWHKGEGEVAEDSHALAKEKLMPPPASTIPPSTAAAEVTVASPNKFMEKKDEAATLSAKPDSTELSKVEEVPVAVTPPALPSGEEKPSDAASSPASATTKKVAEVSSKPSSAAIPAETGSVQVQLAALKTSAEATSTWTLLKKKHGDLLSGRQYLIVKAELPKGTFYRLRISGLGSNAAKQICSQLSARKQSCMVIR